jgi:N-acetylglucosamine kinase-like BadF-type ATPase
VICGTGFNACAIAPDGRQAKLHSLGPLTGDWGGGYSLGEAMFGAVYRADEGRGAPTMLARMLLNALNLDSLDALTRLVTDNAVNDAQVGALAPLVFTAAALGDAVAQSIIQRQADEICIAVMALLRRLDMTQLELDVVLAGGVIQDPNPVLITSVSNQLLAENPKINVRRLEVPPVIGATLLAFDLMGMPIPDAAKTAWAERAQPV